MTWKEIVPGLLVVGYLAYSKVQEQLDTLPVFNPNNTTEQVSQGIPKEQITKDVNNAAKLIAETTTARELKQKSTPFLAEVEKRYKNDPVMGDIALSSLKEVIADEIHKREQAEM